MNTPHEYLNGHEAESRRERLARAVRNESYRSYAEGEGPLLLEQVAPDALAQEEFTKVSDHFGWPEATDASIRPLEQYHDDQAFLNALLVRPGKSPHLNNFISWLSQEPTYDAVDFTEPMERLYARAPALHRLHALMPELAQPMQMMISDLRRRNGTRTADFNDELQSEANKDLVTATRMAYHVIGRLLTTHDKRLHRALVFPGPAVQSAPDVTDAYEELTT